MHILCSTVCTCKQYKYFIKIDDLFVLNIKMWYNKNFNLEFLTQYEIDYQKNCLI